MSVINEDDPRLVFVPIEHASTPPGGIIQHLKDRYWCVHPTRGLVFWTSQLMWPQCDSDERCSKAIRDEVYPWADVVFVPSVFRLVNPRDFG
jgi:hypothetical protein